MTLALGLSFVLGTTAVFAREAPKKPTKTEKEERGRSTSALTAHFSQ